MSWDKAYMRVPVCKRPDYAIYYEQVGEDTWCHMDVRRWTPAISKSAKRDIETLVELFGGGKLFALNYPHGDSKQQKFFKWSGFGFLGRVVGKEGERFVYARQT